jgi:predicted DNA-binding transcriptional regulator AlpA
MQTATSIDRSRKQNAALDDEALLTSAHVKELCGSVSDMCIWRWLRDPRVQFPQPIKLNKRNYWRRGDIRAWQAMHSGKSRF